MRLTKLSCVTGACDVLWRGRPMSYARVWNGLCALENLERRYNRGFVGEEAVLQPHPGHTGQECP